jgi:hypothetical protein
VNRGFVASLIALLVCAEVGLRLVPTVSIPLFELVYGDALAMYLTVGERLRAQASDIRLLVLGDSLAMTQFRPDVFAREVGHSEGEVFNAAYPNMSFVSQERLLRDIGLDRFEHLEDVLFFINVYRFSKDYEPNTEVQRVGIPDPDGPWEEVIRTKRVAPILDHSRLYGLSYYLVWSSWRQALFEGPSWDRVEFLGPHGGVSWPEQRPEVAPPTYPYSRLVEVSPDRMADMRRVLELFRSRDVRVTILRSVVHSGIDPFASEAAEIAVHAAVKQVALATGSRYLPNGTAGFEMPRDADFCDYGHTNIAGGEAFTRWLAVQRGEILRIGAP